MQNENETKTTTDQAESSLRYRWQRFLGQRDAEIESLGEITVLAQSVDDGAYSDERVLKTADAKRLATI